MDDLAFGGNVMHFHETGRSTDGRITLIEHTVAPMTMAGPPHVHHGEDELTLLLDGELTVIVGERLTAIAAGQSVWKPRDVAHAFWNASDRPARLVEIVTPAGLEDYFASLAELFADGAMPDLRQVAPLAAGHGLEFVGSPAYFASTAQLFAEAQGGPPDMRTWFSLVEEHFAEASSTRG
ncbi:MAG: cupin domain-containing protein [Candidatus Limnocylindria bacterium]